MKDELPATIGEPGAALSFSEYVKHLKLGFCGGRFSASGPLLWASVQGSRALLRMAKPRLTAAEIYSPPHSYGSGLLIHGSGKAATCSGPGTGLDFEECKIRGRVFWYLIRL